MAARTKAPQIDMPPQPTGRLIGYARVSTVDQNLDMQISALRKAGIPEQDIYSESVSGVSRRRPAFAAAMKACRPGDTLVAWRLDRIGRDTGHLIKMLEDFRVRGIHIKSLTEPIDTTSPIGALMFHFIAALAQFERNLVSVRTKAGMQRRRERGERVGPEPKLNDKQRREIMKLLRSGGNAKDVAKQYNVSRQTVYRVRWHFQPKAT